MRHFKSQKLKHLRNALVIIGIALGFFIWLAIPSTIDVSIIGLSGYGGGGSKLIILPLLSLPLFAFFGTHRKSDIYDDSLISSENTVEEFERRAARDQVIFAIIEDSIVIVLMTIMMFINK